MEVVESPSLDVFKKHIDIELLTWFNSHGDDRLIVGLDVLSGVFSN